MNFLHLRAFHAVVRERSFTRAALALNISQPTISAQVKALEEFHGVRLLNRRGHGVAPTEAGTALFEKTREVFRLESEMEQLLDHTNKLQAGRLRVCADGPRAAVSLVARFMTRYPGVNVSLSTGNAHEVLDDLLNFRGDVAIIALPRPDPRLYTAFARRISLRAFVASTHPWAGEDAISIKAFARERVMLREPSSLTRIIFMKALSEAGVRLRSTVEMGGREAVHEAVARGIGVSAMSDLEFQEADRRVASVPIHDADLHFNTYTACLSGQESARAVRAFFALCDEERDTAASEFDLNAR